MDDARPSTSDPPGRSPTPAPPPRGRRALLLGLAAAVLVGFVGFRVLARRAAPRYLADDAPARWIVYPTPFGPVIRTADELTTEFRRTFRVETVPGRAVLRARGFRLVAVELNGRPVGAGAAGAPEVEADVSALLRAGDNELVARVTNDLGPPALWLALTADGAAVSSDADWSSSLVGAARRPARRAADSPGLHPGSAVADRERTGDGVRAQAGVLVAFAVVSGLALAAGPRLARRRRPAWATGRRLVAAGVVATWAAVFVPNDEFLPYPLGYDAAAHLEYVKFVHDRSALPPANQGLETHQPPLYYAASAALLRACGVPPDGGAACARVLRLVGVFSGLAAVLLTALTLGRVFPDRPVARAAGVAFAAAFPPHLYMAHYLSNDLPAGALATAVVYLAVVAAQSPRPGWRVLVGLGACAGLAILTKLTAVPVVAAVFGVLAVRAVWGRSVRAAVRDVGVPVAVCALVCGWFFARNYQQFGRPIVGSYEPDIARWWQDPGYTTAGQFERFGRALVDPYYAMVDGVPDGLYATMWGDGGWGGRLGLFRPPWRYDLMAAGYLLALVPCALGAVGWVALAARLARAPTVGVGLLVLVPPASAGAIVVMYASHPYYALIKSFYALPAAAGLCAAVGYGFDALAGRSRWRRGALGVLLGTWALAAVGSFTVPDPADARATAAVMQMRAGDARGAEDAIRRAAEADGGSARVRLIRGLLLRRAGRAGEAEAEFRRAAEAAPDLVEPRIQLAFVVAERGDSAQALRLVEDLAGRAADDVRPHQFLAELRDRDGDARGAAAAAREGLRVAPTDPLLHLIVARYAVRAGETDEGLRHYRLALRFKPDFVPALVGQAWVLAAHEDAGVRNGAEAVRLAELALQLTEGRAPPVWRVLAAAVAEAGDLPEAERIAARFATPPPGGQRPPEAVERFQRDRDAYRAGRALREKPATIPDR
jgi:tetratricopeptide (TPR) repeat protein